MIKVLFLLFIVVAFVAITGEAIKCYECGIDNSKCVEFDSKASGVVEKVCDEKLKTCFTVIMNANGTTVGLRTCGKPSYSNLIFGNSTQLEMRIAICDGDLCNGVSSTVASLTTLAVVVVPLLLTSWH